MYSHIVPACLQEDDDDDMDFVIHDALRACNHSHHGDGGQPSCGTDERKNGNGQFDYFAEKLGLFAKSLTSLGGSTDGTHENSSDNAIACNKSDKTANVLVAVEQRATLTSTVDPASVAYASEEDQVNDEAVQQVLFSSPDVVEVFDPTFRFCFELPSVSITHLPPARLNITRLVFCRNYQPGEPSSCTMGDGCKFVHADVDFRLLQAHPIHVKYAWRHEDLCTYARLPAGETLRVTAPNNRPPVEEIPSERVLVTRGSLKRHDCSGQLAHCAHYYFNRMCNRGERCNFIHVVHVDPNVVGEFKRAPCCKTSKNALEMSGLQQQSSRMSMNPNVKPFFSSMTGEWMPSQQQSSTANPATSGLGITKQLNYNSAPFVPGASNRQSSTTTTTTVAYVPQATAAPFVPPAQSKPPIRLAAAHMPMTNAFATPSWTSPTLPVQFGGDHLNCTAPQYGMLVFVPCDESKKASLVSPAILNPPNGAAGESSSNIQLLPSSAMDLLNAAFPSLAARWASPQGDPTLVAGSFFHGTETTSATLPVMEEELGQSATSAPTNFSGDPFSSRRSTGFRGREGPGFSYR